MPISKEDIVIVPFSKIEHLEKRCKEIAKFKLPYTYDRYNYSEKQRLDKLFQGEQAQAALRVFFEEEGIEYEDYDDIRKDGYRNSDPWDFRVKSKDGKMLELDIKSSINRYNYSIEQLLKNNFTVPSDQDVKDITVQIFINLQSKEFLIMGFIVKEELFKKENLGYLNKVDKPYYKKNIHFGISVKKLGQYLGDKSTLTKNSTPFHNLGRCLIF